MAGWKQRVKNKLIDGINDQRSKGRSQNRKASTANRQNHWDGGKMDAIDQFGTDIADQMCITGTANASEKAAQQKKK